ncbi:Subtilase family protein [Forsythia ovata]|uniref:Subtilase family protein n=1 Tax=Forsythia ovata TaxID=205694 RepID=A0ABD1SLN2_9LAMI
MLISHLKGHFPSGKELLTNAHFIPTTMIGQIAADKIRTYSRSNPLPIATIKSRETVISRLPPDPCVTSISSRGPDYRTSEILKPDALHILVLTEIMETKNLKECTKEHQVSPRVFTTSLSILCRDKYPLKCLEELV